MIEDYFCTYIKTSFDITISEKKETERKKD